MTNSLQRQRRLSDFKRRIWITSKKVMNKSQRWLKFKRRKSKLSLFKKNSKRIEKKKSQFQIQNLHLTHNLPRQSNPRKHQHQP